MLCSPPRHRWWEDLYSHPHSNSNRFLTRLKTKYRFVVSGLYTAVTWLIRSCTTDRIPITLAAQQEIDTHLTSTWAFHNFLFLDRSFSSMTTQFYESSELQARDTTLCVAIISSWRHHFVCHKSYTHSLFMCHTSYKPTTQLCVTRVTNLMAHHYHHHHILENCVVGWWLVWNNVFGL